MLKQRAMRNAAVAVACAFLSFSFAATAHAQCGALDVVFAIDPTGSMGGVLENVKAQIPTIIDQINKASGGNYQLALVTFPEDNVVVDVDLGAKNADAIKAAVAKLTAGGGAAEPESSDEAVRTAVDNLKASDRPAGKQTGDFKGTWRVEATKIVILVTDARPGGFDDTYTPGVDDVDVQNIAKDAATKNIHISAVFVPTDSGAAVADTVATIMQSYATLSSGIYIKTKSDGSGTSDAITDIISHCGGGLAPGQSNLLIEPNEIALTNGQTGIVRITNFAPGAAPNLTSYSVDESEPGEFTTKFTPVTTTPETAGTEEVDLSITAGDHTFQGTHMMAVHATTGSLNDLSVIHVIVDCRPPFFLATGQPQNATVPTGSQAALTANPSGDGPMHLQWYRGQSGITLFPVAGATSAQLKSDPVTGSASYWLRATNACGSRDSATAVVNPQ